MVEVLTQPPQALRLEHYGLGLSTGIGLALVGAKGLGCEGDLQAAAGANSEVLVCAPHKRWWCALCGAPSRLVGSLRARCLKPGAIGSSNVDALPLTLCYVLAQCRLPPWLACSAPMRRCDTSIRTLALSALKASGTKMASLTVPLAGLSWPKLTYVWQTGACGSDVGGGGQGLARGGGWSTRNAAHLAMRYHRPGDQRYTQK